MAHERPPGTTFGSLEELKRYRPDSTRAVRTHLVKDQANARNPTEDLLSIARTNGVDVVRLVEFNFPGSVANGVILPEVVNWYLHHHKEFGCPDTRSGKNRMFRGGEKLYIPDTREDPYKRLVDRTRERWTKAVEALRQRLQRLLAGEARALASPNKAPAVVRYWQEEVGRTRGQLEENERYLRELAQAEQKEGNSQKVWKEITRTPAYYDDMIRRQRELITSTQQRQAEAEEHLRKTRGSAEEKFWNELVEDYRSVLKSRQDDLNWLIKDQEEAKRVK